LDQAKTILGYCVQEAPGQGHRAETQAEDDPMKNQNEKKLSLKRATLRNLTPNQLGAVVGGDDIIVIGGVVPETELCSPH
jgi:hypothetical protein